MVLRDYGDANDVTGDKVLEQYESTFDGTNRHRFPRGSAQDHLWVEAEDGVFTCGVAGSGSAYAVTAEGSDLAAAVTFTFTTAASSATYRFWLRTYADGSGDG